MLRGLILAAVLAAFITATGCGGGDSTVSQEEFHQQLRLACNKGLQARETLVRRLTREYYETREQRATAKYHEENLLKVIATYQQTTDEIEDIGLPDGGEAEAEALIGARREAATKVEADPRGTRENLPAIFKPANEKAEALDVDTCVV